MRVPLREEWGKDVVVVAEGVVVGVLEALGRVGVLAGAAGVDARGVGRAGVDVVGVELPWTDCSALGDAQPAIAILTAMRAATERSG